MISDINIILRLIVATILSAVIGFEREKMKKPAGLRTYMLVCLGSCLITIVSMSFGEDPARIASNIITGVGFLGAGVIIAQGANVIGVTTAASLWAVSAVGLCVGIGEYLLAIITTLLIYIILKLKRYEEIYESFGEKAKED
ncbi:MAG: MgtC/SapB family protein [Candidatus Altiarchaeota archaeon]